MMIQKRITIVSKIWSQRRDTRSQDLLQLSVVRVSSCLWLWHWPLSLSTKRIKECHVQPVQPPNCDNWQRPHTRHWRIIESVKDGIDFNIAMCNAHSTSWPKTCDVGKSITPSGFFDSNSQALMQFNWINEWIKLNWRIIQIKQNQLSRSLIYQ